MSDYKRINEIYPFQEYFGAPYALVGRSLCAKLNRWKDENAASNPRLLVFFENGTKHKGDFEEAMRRDKLPCPIFLDKKAATPLQAADLLSWEVFTAIKTGAVLRTGLVRDSFQTLLGTFHRRRFHSIYKLIDLKRMCESQNLPLRENIHPDTHIAYRHSPKRGRRRTIF